MVRYLRGEKGMTIFVLGRFPIITAAKIAQKGEKICPSLQYRTNN